MFTIPSAACIAGACSIYFGTVDWNSSYSAGSFELDNGWRIHLKTVLSDSPKERAELRKLIGAKGAVCVGKVISARYGIAGDCYLDNHTQEGLNIGEEMHRRGF